MLFLLQKKNPKPSERFEKKKMYEQASECKCMSGKSGLQMVGGGISDLSPSAIVEKFVEDPSYMAHHQMLLNKRLATKKYDKYDLSTLHPKLTKFVRDMTKLKTFSKSKHRQFNANHKLSYRFMNHNQFSQFPKLAGVDTSSWRYNVGFKLDPEFATQTKNFYDKNYLNQPHLYQQESCRESLRGPYPIHRNVFSGSVVATITGTHPL